MAQTRTKTTARKAVPGTQPRRGETGRKLATSRTAESMTTTGKPKGKRATPSDKPRGTARTKDGADVRAGSYGAVAKRGRRPRGKMA